MSGSKVSARMTPAVRTAGDATGTAASEVAHAVEVLREQAGPAVSSAVDAVREKGLPAAVAAVETVREKAGPAAVVAVEVVRERGLPAAVAAADTVRHRAGPAASAAVDAVRDHAPVVAAAAGTVRSRARTVEKQTRGQRREARRRAHRIGAAARGEQPRRWPFILGAFLLGAALGTTAGLARRRAAQSSAPAYGEDLNGSGTQDTTRLTEEQNSEH